MPSAYISGDGLGWGIDLRGVAEEDGQNLWLEVVKERALLRLTA